MGWTPCSYPNADPGQLTTLLSFVSPPSFCHFVSDGEISVAICIFSTSGFAPFCPIRKTTKPYIYWLFWSGFAGFVLIIPQEPVTVRFFFPPDSFAREGGQVDKWTTIFGVSRYSHVADSIGPTLHTHKIENADIGQSMW